MLLELSKRKQNKSAFKVIADHLRASSFMISEGILPSNEGRGYVLRRILRRAVRYSYMLGYSEPLIYKLFSACKAVMSSTYKELEIRENFIKGIIKQEEIKFHETFSNGIKILNEEIDKISKGEVFSGKTAFKLYDTYGFPVDLTKDVLREKHIKLNEIEFEQASQNHRNLAKKSWQGIGTGKEDIIWFDLSKDIPATDFVGHDTLYQESIITAIVIYEDETLKQVSSTFSGEVFIITDKTPFYAEMGGQVGDRGKITLESGDFLIVLDTQKRVGDIFIHKVILDNLKLE